MLPRRSRNALSDGNRAVPRRAVRPLAANAHSHTGNVIAVVAFATTLPLALGAFVGGPIVDRIGIRRASVVADVGSGAATALMPLLHAQEPIPPEVVPLSMLLYGFVLDSAGLHAALVLFAGGNVLLAACAVGNRPARQLASAGGAA